MLPSSPLTTSFNKKNLKQALVQYGLNPNSSDKDLYCFVKSKYSELIDAICNTSKNVLSKPRSVRTLRNCSSDTLNAHVFYADIVPAMIDVLGLSVNTFFTRKHDGNLSSLVTSNNPAQFSTESLDRYAKSQVKLSEHVNQTSSSSSYNSSDLTLFSPLIKKNKYILYPQEIQDEDIIKRVLHHVATTSTLFWNIMGMKQVNSNFGSLDFTAICDTFKQYKQSYAAESLNKLRGLRNNWAHFVFKNTVPPETMDNCFMWSKQLYTLLLEEAVKQKKPMPAIERLKSRMSSLKGIQTMYKLMVLKRKSQSQIEAMYFSNKSSEEETKRYEVAKDLLQKMMQKLEDKQDNKFVTQFLLDYVPNSQFLSKEIESVYRANLSAEEIPLNMLMNQYEVIIKEVSILVKMVNVPNMVDQRFIHFPVFLSSLLTTSGNTRDESTFHLLVLKKAFKALQKQGYSIDSGLVEKAKQRIGISLTEEQFESIIGQYRYQFIQFQNFWVLLGNCFELVQRSQMPDAILYLGWCWSRLEDSSFLSPIMKAPYQEIVARFLVKACYLLVEQISYFFDVHNLVGICLGTAFKFYEVNGMEDVYSNAMQLVKDNGNALGELTATERVVVELINKGYTEEQRKGLLSIAPNFVKLRKMERKAASEEATICFQEASAILFE